jgi:hypothetical protein
MNNQDTNNEASVLEDLTTPDAAEIKGGPNPKSKRTVVLQSSVAGEIDDDTLGGLSSNHNETFAADDAEYTTATNDEEAGALLDLEPSGAVNGGAQAKDVAKMTVK